MKKIKNKVLVLLIKLGVIHIRTSFIHTGKIGNYNTWEVDKTTFHLGRKKKP